MARKRVNVTFIVIAAVVVLGFAALGVAYKMKLHKRIIHGSPEKHIARARQLMAEGKWEDANEALYIAGGIRGGDPELSVMIGDCWNNMAGESPENFAKGAGYWANALTLDPRYIPALERLLNRARDLAEEAPFSTFFESLRDAAQKYLAADPDNKQAQYLLHMASVQLWMSGGNIDRATVDDSIAALEQLFKEDPAHADAMYYIARTRMHRAQEAYRSNDDATMKTLLDEVATMAATATQTQPDNADIRFRTALIHLEMSGIQRSLKGDYEKWEELARQEALKARELVKVGDAKYMEIQFFQARLFEQKNMKAEAEKIYRELMEQYPKEQRIRLALGAMLGKEPGRRDEAIALLSLPIVQPSELVGVKAMAARDNEARTIAALLDLKIDSMLSMTASERTRLLQELEPQYQRLLSLRGERGDVLLVRGRMQVTKGDMIGAVQTFNAVMRSPDWGSMRFLDRLQTMDYLAKGYLATNQIGQAKRILMEMIRSMDSFPGGESSTLTQRLLLLDVLMRENLPQEAKPHVAVVEKLLKPDDPRLPVVRMAALDRTTQKSEMKKLWDTMPEGERPQVVEKARIAMTMLNDDDLAAKLLDKYRKAHPDDMEMTLAIAQLYASSGRNADAQKVVEEALASAPQDERLLRVQKALKGEATFEDIKQVREKEIEAQADPFMKLLMQSDLALAEKKNVEAIKYLLEAEKLKPDNIRVLDLLHRSYVAEKDWTQAEEYLNRLGKVNPEVAIFQRPRFAMARGQAKEAMDLALALTRERGDFAQSWLTLAQVQHATGRLLDAIASYRTCLERDSRNLEAMQGLVECYYRAGNPTDAKRYLDAAARIYPDNVSVREQLLMHEVHWGDAEKAIGPRDEQLKKDQTNPFNWIALGQAYFAAARARQAEGKVDQAKSHLQKSMDVFQEAYVKFPDDSRFASAIAEVALKMQKPEIGEKSLRALMEREAWKDRVEPHLMLADYLLLCNRTEDAEKIFRQVFEKTKDVSIQMRLAELLNRTKGVDEAVKVLQENSEKSTVQRLRIDMLVRAGRIEEAQKDLESLMGGQPHTAVTLELQASIYMNSNRPVEAMQTLDKALELDPNYALALYRRGYLKLYARGDPQGAIEDLTQVRKLAPVLTDPRVTLAHAYRFNGDINGGIRELEEAVRDNPTDRNVRVTLMDFYSNAIPARWNDLQRLLEETRELPQYSRDAHFMLVEANMWTARNDWNKAMEAIKLAANTAPNDLTILKTFFEILVKANAHAELLKLSDRMVQNQSNLWWVYRARGVARARLNDKDAALLEFEQALKIANEQGDDRAAQEVVSDMAREVGFAAAMRRVEPKAQNDSRWRMVALQLCRAQGDFETGLKWSQMLLDDPMIQGQQREMVLGMTGEFHYSKNPPDVIKAVEVFKQMAEQFPDNPGALNNLAAVMTMPGSPYKPEEALVYSQKAYEIMNRKGNIIPEVLDTHGSILVDVGRIDDGIAMLQNAVDRKPIPDAYYHLGDAYLRQSKPQEAERALRQAKEIISRAERDRQPFDGTLKDRVEEALIKATTMMQQKSSSASDGAK